MYIHVQIIRNSQDRQDYKRSVLKKKGYIVNAGLVKKEFDREQKKKNKKKSDQIRATTFKNVFEKCMDRIEEQFLLHIEKCMDRIEEQFLLHICIFAFKKKGYITLTQGEKNLQNLRPYGLCRTCIIRVRKQNYVTLKKEREIYIELLTFKIGF
eukprot:TRINITY_DN21315_c0_g1_i2.p2 TRINITY_DN21315_c0_g1~~TRINITY_DN21315_c0_g1_i2.p2  ORF type:complete len:154 (-),score=13.04 TRINITY_DN21315_c0_g1_i2:94-555(-)